MSHHGIRVNYAPDDLERNVDQWHRDAISFDHVLMVNDPRPMKGVVSNTSSAEWWRKELIESGPGTSSRPRGEPPAPDGLSSSRAAASSIALARLEKRYRASRWSARLDAAP